MKQTKSIKRLIPLFILLAALIISIMTLVKAHYIRNSNELENIFTPAKSVLPSIIEDFDHKVKKDVKIGVGQTEYPVYVRASIVITWQDEDTESGNMVVYFEPPAEAVQQTDSNGDPVLDSGGKPVYDGDYILDLNLSENGWIKGDDGYYYYTQPVNSGEYTGILIKECKLLDPEYDEHILSVEIIAQTIQAVGVTDDEHIPAYTDAWGISLSSDANSIEP